MSELVTFREDIVHWLDPVLVQPVKTRPGRNVRQEQENTLSPAAALQIPLTSRLFSLFPAIVLEVVPVPAVLQP